MAVGTKTTVASEVGAGAGASCAEAAAIMIAIMATKRLIIFIEAIELSSCNVIFFNMKILKLLELESVWEENGYRVWFI